MTTMWKTLLLAILVGLVGAKQNVIIGYRTVTKEQADIYNKAGTLVWTGNRKAAQIGEGAYLTPDPAGWDGLWAIGMSFFATATADPVLLIPVSSQRYCVVLANKHAFDKVKKVWVPEFNACNDRLWFGEGYQIDHKIKSFGACNPAKTVRLSEITGIRFQHTRQIVIPPKLMGSKPSKNGPLDITVQCRETLAELPSYVAKIYDWPNTVGTPQ